MADPTSVLVLSNFAALSFKIQHQNIQNNPAVKLNWNKNLGVWGPSYQSVTNQISASLVEISCYFFLTDLENLHTFSMKIQYCHLTLMFEVWKSRINPCFSLSIHAFLHKCSQLSFTSTCFSAAAFTLTVLLRELNMRAPGLCCSAIYVSLLNLALA